METDPRERVNGDTRFSKSNILVNSQALIGGNNQQYIVPITPQLNDVVSVELLSFSAVVKPYNVISNTEYTIQVYYEGDPPTAYTWTTMIFAGCYTVGELINILNANSMVNFQHQPQTGKVIITRLLWNGQDEDPGGAIFSDCVEINTILGFPVTETNQYGFLDQWFVPGPANPGDVIAIQSFAPVTTLTQPLPIVIAFENIPSYTTTTSAIGGTFTVEVPPPDPITKESIVKWTSNSHYVQKFATNHIKLTSLPIRICSPIEGSPYEFPGPHSMLLSFVWRNSTF